MNALAHPRLTPFALRGLLTKLGPSGRGAVRRAPQDPTTQDADDEVDRYLHVTTYAAGDERRGDQDCRYPTPLMCERPPPTTRRKRAARR